jgi:predicted transcriptional regulator
MERLNESLRTAAVLLGALGRGEMRWTDLVRVGYQASTPWRVHSIICWLVGLGYVHRPRRGVYMVTERGRALLEALPKPRKGA